MKPSPALRSELDGVVVNIELTLASIVQGLALSFLAESAGKVFSEGKFSAWPYVGVALVMILLFWSRALIHTLTLIRWPLEFVHNFFYFGCALVEVLAFMHLHDPLQWFVWNTIFAALVWALFVHDLRIIRMRGADSVGPSGDRLYRAVESDQWMNIRLVMPVAFAINLGCVLAIRSAPSFFLERQGHLLLIGCQGLGLSLYLVHVVRAFGKLIPLISATRAEWQDDELK